MNFYSSIAEHYDAIFPFNKQQLSFISSHSPVEKSSQLIEVGSGRGVLTNACAEAGYQVRGLELDATMVTLAQIQYPKVSFHCENMLNLERTFTPGSCDTMVCFGNTIVHLPSTEDMLTFLKAAYKTLSSNGTLLLQFINYDRILDNNIKALPTITTDKVSFVRDYELISETKLNFRATLTVHADRMSSQSLQALYPLRRERFEALAQEAGFSCEAYSNFKSEAWAADGMQSIFVCKKG